MLIKDNKHNILIIYIIMSSAITATATATATVTATATSTTNHNEIQRLYNKLLPFSMYDNPYKQYPRKIKLKRQPPHHPHSIPHTEFVITSFYPTNNVVCEDTIVKPRKKMKLTSSCTLVEPSEIDSPKDTKNVEEEPYANVIILNPREHEKMKNTKYSLAELKSLCCHYSIKKSGTKPELTQRIYIHLKQSYYIVRLQRSFRNFISRKYCSISGPGYLHTNNCVNDTDFYTFDTLSKIRPTELFTYRDNDNKIYGFHIASLFHLIITSYPNITNPYNRKVIPSTIINNLYEKLVYGSLLGFRVSVKLDEEQTNETTDGIASMNGSNGLSREKQEELFIVDLFQHINTLGNYSDSEWFIALQRVELIRFIRNVYDIWYYRANLSQEMKERICPPNGNPFVIQNSHINLSVLTMLTDPEIRTICVSIIERMVRRGITREDQCLGAFYVLATLTIVSQDARTALPWLYDAVM
jgi:hypothetical protein